MATTYISKLHFLVKRFTPKWIVLNLNFDESQFLMLFDCGFLFKPEYATNLEAVCILCIAFSLRIYLNGTLWSAVVV
jgi:hypothetical protein